MGLTLKEVMYLNADYIKINRIMADQFKNGRPRDNWFKNFMKRYKLSMKKAEMISTARKANTSNPFITYGFLTNWKSFSRIQKRMKKNFLTAMKVGFQPGSMQC